MQPLDVCCVKRKSEVLRYSVVMAAYGFFGDVMQDSEKLRWMGPKRYDVAGFKKFMSNRYVLIICWLSDADCLTFKTFRLVLKLRQNGQQKRAIYIATLCNTSWEAMLCILPPAFKSVLQQSRLLRGSWRLYYARVSHTIRESYVTCSAAKQVCLGPVKPTTCTDFVAKSRTALYFLLQLAATCNNMICCKTGWICGRKTRNIATYLVLLQSCWTSRTFFLSLPVLLFLKALICWNDELLHVILKRLT